MIKIYYFFLIISLASCAAINKGYKNVDFGLDQNTVSVLTDNKVPLGPGGLYSSQQNVMDVARATSNHKSTKSGKACVNSVLGIVNWGDASIFTASKSADIESILVVDGSSQTILGVWAEYCTIVYGI